MIARQRENARSMRDESESAPRRSLTLRQSLGLLLLVCLVAPLCVSYLWTYFQSGRYLRQVALRNVDNVASFEALQIELYVQHARSIFASSVVGDIRLVNLARTLPTSDGDVRRRIRDRLEAVRLRVHDLMPVQEIRILSPAGDVLASTRELRGVGTDAGIATCMKNAGDGPTVTGVSDEPTGWMSGR